MTQFSSYTLHPPNGKSRPLTQCFQTVCWFTPIVKHLWLLCFGSVRSSYETSQVWFISSNPPFPVRKQSYWLPKIKSFHLKKKSVCYLLLPFLKTLQWRHFQRRLHNLNQELSMSKGWLQSQGPRSSQQAFSTQVGLILAFTSLIKGTE